MRLAVGYEGGWGSRNCFLGRTKIEDYGMWGSIMV